jgi:hypothetical protein
MAWTGDQALLLVRVEAHRTGHDVTLIEVVRALHDATLARPTDIELSLQSSSPSGGLEALSFLSTGVPAPDVRSVSTGTPGTPKAKRCAATKDGSDDVGSDASSR